jgi:hypothetical protein
MTTTKIEALENETRAALVEITGESKSDRYRRIERLAQRVDAMRGGFQVWTDEHARLGALYREVFAFRAFGVRKAAA